MISGSVSLKQPRLQPRLTAHYLRLQHQLSDGSEKSLGSLSRKPNL